MRAPTRFATIALALIALVPLTRAAAAAPDDETMKPDEKMSDEKMTATTRPTTRPAFRKGTTPQAGGLLERLRENADKLGLSDGQKTEIQKLAQTARDRTREILRDANGDRDKARKDISEMMRSTFEEIRAILTPDQQKKLREILSENGGFRTPNMGENREKVRVSPEKKITPATQPVTDVTTLQLKKIDGKPLIWSTLKGKPTVLIFGSYSSPTFRENAKSLDELARHYGTKASFIMVYTKEAHPTGGWEVQRNKDAEIAIPQHSDEAARLAAAKQAKAKLGLTMPMVIDSMDDQAAMGLDAFPDGAVVLDPAGLVKTRQKWAESRGLRVILDEILLTNPNISDK